MIILVLLVPKLAAQSNEMTFPGSHNLGQIRVGAGSSPGFYADHLIQLAVFVARVTAMWESRDIQEAELWHPSPPP